MGAVTAEGVLERFAQVAGLAEEEAAAWETLCADALAELSAQRLDRDWDTAQDGLFCSACAALAYYRYALSAAGPTGFTAGDLRVEDPNAVDRARALWDSLARAAAGQLDGGGFAFRRTQ